MDIDGVNFIIAGLFSWLVLAAFIVLTERRK